MRVPSSTVAGPGGCLGSSDMEFRFVARLQLVSLKAGSTFPFAEGTDGFQQVAEIRDRLLTLRGASTLPITDQIVSESNPGLLSISEHQPEHVSS